jgi:hypothetical protein
MWACTGNPFEGFEAQRFWGVHSLGNLLNIPKFVCGWCNPNDWHGFSGSLLDRAIFVVMMCCVPVLWRLSKPLVLWAYILGVVPAMSGAFTCYTRYASVAFPFFLALGVLLAPPDRRWLRYGVLGAFVVIHVALVWRYVNFQWAS